MSNLVNLLSHSQVSPDYDVQIIQIRFNGEIVLQIDQGQQTYEKLVPSNLKLNSLEIFWDEEVVYAIQEEEVIVDRLLLYKNQMS